MNQPELVNWLFENAGAVIRYRTASELMSPSSEVDIAQLRRQLRDSRLVKGCFERFRPSLILNDIHGSKATSFENVMGRLTDLGLRCGDAELDRYASPYRDWLSENAERPLEHVFDVFGRTLVAAFLARAGYNQDVAVGGVLRKRLETIHDFVRRCSYDVYVSPAHYPRMPRSFAKKPLINPTLSEDGNLSLPWIYDILGLAAYLPEQGTEDDWIQANTIVEYVLNDRYQRLDPGYGILRGKNGRYYAMGWSVWLPGFFDDPSCDTRLGLATTDMMLGNYVQRLVLIGQFPAAVRHPWFSSGLNHLQALQTERGTYLFPRSYLPERTTGYWVTGAHMALEEDRRSRQALELESSFWMAKLMQLRSARVEAV